jgi:hypothetical protein
VLNQAHLGDIQGVMGTIQLDDEGGRATRSVRCKTLLAIVARG